MRSVRWVADHLAILCLALILLCGGVYVHDQATSRQRSQRSVCSTFEAYTNALITISTPSKTPEDRAKKQAQTDSFERDLEVRLAPLNCDLHLIPVR